MKPRPYLPAAGRDWALPFYDPLVRLLGADKTRRELLDQAAVGRSARVLDVGCGTGTMATIIKRVHPEVEVVGLDPDPKALARARRKAERAAVLIRFDQGFSDELPYADASFERVFSSFMFHHLPADQRGKALREIRRVLVPGGSLHLVDFLTPDGRAGRRLRDNSDSRILLLLREAGFSSLKKVREGTLLFGLLRIGYYCAAVAAASGEGPA